MDFNIYDILKGKNEGEGDNTGSTDEFILLLKNLENKVFKKLELQDDRLKKDEECCLNNEKIFKNLFEKHNQNFIEIREELIKINQTLIKIDQTVIDNRTYCESNSGGGNTKGLDEFRKKVNDDLLR